MKGHSDSWRIVKEICFFDSELIEGCNYCGDFKKRSFFGCRAELAIKHGHSGVEYRTLPSWTITLQFFSNTGGGETKNYRLPRSSSILISSPAQIYIWFSLSITDTFKLPAIGNSQFLLRNQRSWHAKEKKIHEVICSGLGLCCGGTWTSSQSVSLT